MTVMLVAGMGFVNYVLLRIYGNRGLYYTALLGGLVNSPATVAELSTKLAQEGALVAAGAAYFAWSRRDKTIRASGELKLSPRSLCVKCCASDCCFWPSRPSERWASDFSAGMDF